MHSAMLIISKHPYITLVTIICGYLEKANISYDLLGKSRRKLIADLKFNKLKVAVPFMEVFNQSMVYAY